jgi:hypothetical protein
MNFVFRQPAIPHESITSARSLSAKGGIQYKLGIGTKPGIGVDPSKGSYRTPIASNCGI